RVASSSTFSAANFALSGNASATTHVVWLVLTYNDYGTGKTIDVESHADAASWQVDSTTNPSIAADTWLRFTLAIDWNAKTYDVLLNGTPIGQQTAFSAAYFERIDLWATQGLVYFDEIEMLP